MLLRAGVITGAIIAMMLSSVAAETTGTQKTPAPRRARVTKFQERCAQIEKDLASLTAETTSTIVLLGDSITEQNQTKQLAGMRVVNQGIGGDQIDIPTSNAGVRRRLHLVAQARPSDVFLMIGINDLWWSGKTVDEAKADYTSLVKALPAAVPNARIHIESVLPTSGQYAYLNPKVVELNKHIQQLASESRLDYIDLVPLMQDEKGELRKELTTDGIHLTAEGYKVLMGVLEQKLKERMDKQ